MKITKFHTFLCVLFLPGILLFPVYSYSYSYYWTVYGSESGLSDSAISALSMDPGGYLWIGSKDVENQNKGGIIVLDRANELTPQFSIDDGLCSNDVNSIAFEHVTDESSDDLDNGSTWIGTDHGISVLDRKGVLTTILSKNSPLPGNTISNIYINKNNTKWISVWGKGVCCVDSDFNWSTYTTNDGLCSNRIISIKEDRNGNLWFGSNSNGVSCLDRDGNWIHFSSSNSGLIGDRIRAIIEEPPNKMWFVTPQGISVFDGRSWMSYGPRNSPLSSFVPTAMLIDRSGNKWIGTEQGGVFKLDRLGMWTHFHRENSSIPDDRINAMLTGDQGDLWIATPAGLCRLGTSPQITYYELTQKEFHEPLSPDFGKGTYYPFETAVMWKNVGELTADHGLSFALPSFFYSGSSWFYAALWANQDFSFQDLQYSISGNRRGNRRISIKGRFSRAIFLTCGGLLSSHRQRSFDKRLSYPFPYIFPEELKEFLSPGSDIPSAQPEIVSFARALVRPSSKDDMYKTARDIVYSKLIQHMHQVENDTGEIVDGEPVKGSVVPALKDIVSVIKDGAADPHSKARLLCTLARAVGLPARIVTSMGGSVWSQLWISGPGWISVELSHPVFDYVRQVRTSIPKIFYPDDHAIATVSGKDDDAAPVMWNPEIDAFSAEWNPAELNDFRQVSTAKLLMVKIVPGQGVPDNAMMEVGDNIFLVAGEMDGEVQLLFQEREGRVLKRLPVSFEGTSYSVNVENRLFWRFIPRKIGEMIVLENLESRIVEDETYRGIISEKERQGIQDITVE